MTGLYAAFTYTCTLCHLLEDTKVVFLGNLTKLNFRQQIGMFLIPLMPNFHES